MKDFIFKILAFIPSFISDLSHLVSNPRKFLPASLNRNDALKHALVFSFMCFSFQVMMDWMTYSFVSDDVWEHVIRGSFQALLAICFVAISIVLAWRMVGGQANYNSVLIYLCYLQGVFFILSGFESSVNLGLLRFFAPDLAGLHKASLNVESLATIMDMTKSELYTDQLAAYGSVAVVASVIFLPLTLLWLLCAWLSYKDLLKSTWYRAVMFAVPFIVLWIGFSLFNNFLSYTFSKDPININQLSALLEKYDSAGADVQDNTILPKDDINKQDIVREGSEEKKDVAILPQKTEEKQVKPVEKISPEGFWINQDGEYWQFFNNGVVNIATLEGITLYGTYKIDGTKLTGEIIVSEEVREWNGTFAFEKDDNALAGNVFWLNQTHYQYLTRNGY